jgi:hypothetical protein
LTPFCVTMSSGKATVVALTRTGVPTLTVTPGGVTVKIKSLACTVLKLTGREKVTTNWFGEVVRFEPGAGVTVTTRSTSMA